VAGGEDKSEGCGGPAERLSKREERRVWRAGGEDK
jgi:hypothetical protein